MTRDEILTQHSLLTHLERSGIKLRGNGKERTATRCAGVAHKPDHWCVSVDSQRELWTCHDCKTGGSLIDWLMIERGQSATDVLVSFNEPKSSTPRAAPRIVALYDYTDESHQLVYQSVRLEPKSFRQRRPDGKGGWIWSMEGITRILFNLPAVLLAPLVAISEGEKDCLTLGSFGYVATCNVGGAGKWVGAYSERLKGKDVIVFPDNDAAGKKHAAEVMASLDGKANSVKMVLIPEPYKDVTEFIESFPDREQAGRELAALVDKTAHTIKPLPIYTLQEMEGLYREHAKKVANHRFDLGKFLPALREHIRPMIPGEVLLLLANTGVGKTLIVQSLLRAAAPLTCLLFELELPLTLVFERYVQMEVGCHARDVHEEYFDQTVPLWTKYKSLQHISVCPESGLTPDEIERFIERSELKLGCRPAVVGVDYVGLLNSRGTRSRYEAISNSAEQMKVIAKRTNTIIIMASQIARPDKKETLEIGLHDGKDSGALENSAGVVIGAWRPERSRLMLKILKNTSGTSGATIEANFDGAKMRITEP